MAAISPPPVAAASDPRALAALRATYFAAFAGLGALAPFLALLLERRGLEPSQIGAAMTVVPLTGLLVPPLWGVVADALRARLLLLRIACIGSALGSLALWPDGGFAYAVAGLFAFAFFRSPLTPLADAATVHALGGEANDFSRVRIWGSVGFAVVAWLVGKLGGSTRPALMLSVAAGAYVVAAASTALLRAPTIARRRGVAGDLWRVIRAPAFLLFLLGTAFHYLGHSVFDAFFGLHAKRLGHGDDVVGSAWSIGVAAEVAVMLAAPRILRVARPTSWLALCGLAAALRWAALSAVATRTGLLGLQALHALSFGLWYLALVGFVQARAPEHLRTSVQSATFACIGLGQVVGYVGGGQLLEALGGTTLYRGAALAALLGAACYAAAGRVAPRRAADPPARPPSKPPTGRTDRSLEAGTLE